MKIILRLMALLCVAEALGGASSVMADGAYSTGVGQGYASYAGTQAIPNGTVIMGMKSRNRPCAGGTQAIPNGTVFMSVWVPYAPRLAALLLR